METRYLSSWIETLSFTANKMVFLSGPRQCGKTTLAKALLSKRGAGQYYNWDDIQFRRLWSKSPSSIIPEAEKITPLIILDELHKASGWKRNLKGVYDTLTTQCDIFVTGSAKLNVYRRGSDSLLGRYDHYRLHPFSLAEIHRKKPENIESLLDRIWDNPNTSRGTQETLLQLDHYGPFPEPFLAANQRRLTLWQRSRVERLIREDLRDLSRLPSLSKIEMLTALLPERVANPLSYQSLGEDLEAAYTTVKHWVDYLKLIYYCYEIKPFSRHLPRTLKKEGKLYVWDWSEVADEAARFENLIASHLLKFVHYLTDIGEGNFELRYIKNKQKKEIDFLILKNRQPWIPIEVKLAEETVSPNWKTFMKPLECTRGIQIVKQPNVFRLVKESDYEICVISAAQFLEHLV